LTFLLALAPAAAVAQGVGQTHVVRPGENLFRIALRYRVSVQALASINGIANPTMIYVGQTLVIPAYGSPSEAQKPTGTPIPPTGTLVPPTDTPTPQPSETITVTDSLLQPTAALTETDAPALPTGTPAPPTRAPAPQPTTHVVAAGENLYRIALRYGLTTDQLAAANGITTYNAIRVGQVLRIPAPGQAIAAPAPSAPGAPVASGTQKVVVSISRQHLWAYSGDKVVFSFVASTGLSSSPTKPGSYRVLDKIPNAYASTWNLQMPYWLGIYYVGRIENGIHALPILSNGQTLWAGLLGRPASFGCVILDTASSKQLYDWVEVGTPVIIQP
jgi:LysM repeat protein